MSFESWFDHHWNGHRHEQKRLRDWEQEWRALLADGLDKEEQRTLQESALETSARYPRPELAEDENTVRRPLHTMERRMDLAASTRPALFTVKHAMPDKVMPGQIWVMPTQPALGELAPALLLVIDQASPAKQGQRWRVVPFGPLSIPASDGEWETSWAQTAPELAVLCFWNHFAIFEDVLKTGVRCFASSAAEKELLESLWLSYRVTSVLPADPRRGSDTPWMAPDDPRREYLDFCEDSLRFWQFATVLPTSFRIHLRPGRLGMQATPRFRSTAPSETLKLVAHSDQLRLTLEKGDVVFTLQSAPGETAAGWDGSLLVTTGGWTTQIRDSRAMVPTIKALNGFALFDAGGGLVRIEVD